MEVWLSLILLLNPHLTLDSNLSWFAQWRADSMAQSGVLSHEIPGWGNSGDVLSTLGYPEKSWGENIGRCICGVQDIEGSFEWSAEHRENLTDPHFHRLGLGIATADDGRTYYVQLLAD